MAMRLSCKFSFLVGILNQHWLLERGQMPMTDWLAECAPKWAVALIHTSAMEEDVGSDMPEVQTGGQEGRW